MTQKLCPACAAQNLLENQFCGQCGSRLDRPLLAPRRQELTIGRGSSLPALRPVGRAAAASLAAIAAKAALSWLRRRAASAAPAPPESGLPQARTMPPAGRVSAVFVRRLVRRWQQGSRGQETVEEELWWYES